MNDEAIGDVTLAIKNLLENGLGNNNAVILTAPWDDSLNNSETGIHLFLYRVEENPHCKNMDWPGNPSQPKKIPAPALSLDLFYLLTPFVLKVNSSNAGTAIDHKVLGKAMRILHSNPVLNDIHNPYFDADNDMHFPENLRNSFKKIEVSLNPINMEEMSKIWAMGNNPYKLSVAYHVSLVQISPVPPAKPIAPPVQKTDIYEPAILAPPAITQLIPPIGPVGTKLHIIGVNLSLQCIRPKVKINERLVTDLKKATEDEIILILPEDIKKGPEQKITVVIGSRESNPGQFLISPWIKNIMPQRGAVNKKDPDALSLAIHGQELEGDVQLSIDGIAVEPSRITTVDQNLIETYIPHTLKNGHHQIDLQINGKPANKRTFEVIPLLKKLNPAQGKAGDRIEIKGQRLKGTKVSVCIGPSVIILGHNAGNNKVSFNVPKRLNPGEYEVKVIVDGHESEAKPFKVIE